MPDLPTASTKIRDLVFIESQPVPRNTKYSCKTEIGWFTVLDRETGYGYCGPMRDIETSFTDNAGEFWLRCGNFDMRRHRDLTVAEAARWIQENATFHCLPRQPKERPNA